MKRPKDIHSQPWHIQEYINHLERKKSLREQDSVVSRIKYLEKRGYTIVRYKY